MFSLNIPSIFAKSKFKNYVEKKPQHIEAEEMFTKKLIHAFCNSTFDFQPSPTLHFSFFKKDLLNAFMQSHMERGMTENKHSLETAVLTNHNFVCDVYKKGKTFDHENIDSKFQNNFKSQNPCNFFLHQAVNCKVFNRNNSYSEKLLTAEVAITHENTEITLLKVFSTNGDNMENFGYEMNDFLIAILKMIPFSNKNLHDVHVQFKSNLELLHSLFCNVTGNNPLFYCNRNRKFISHGNFNQIIEMWKNLLPLSKYASNSIKIADNASTCLELCSHKETYLRLSCDIKYFEMPFIALQESTQSLFWGLQHQSLHNKNLNYKKDEGQVETGKFIKPQNISTVKTRDLPFIIRAPVESAVILHKDKARQRKRKLQQKTISISNSATSNQTGLSLKKVRLEQKHFCDDFSNSQIIISCLEDTTNILDSFRVNSLQNDEHLQFFTPKLQEVVFQTSILKLKSLSERIDFTEEYAIMKSSTETQTTSCSLLPDLRIAKFREKSSYGHDLISNCNFRKYLYGSSLSGNEIHKNETVGLTHKTDVTNSASKLRSEENSITVEKIDDFALNMCLDLNEFLIEEEEKKKTIACQTEISLSNFGSIEKYLNSNKVFQFSDEVSTSDSFKTDQKCKRKLIFMQKSENSSINHMECCISGENDFKTDAVEERENLNSFEENKKSPGNQSLIESLEAPNFFSEPDHSVPDGIYNNGIEEEDKSFYKYDEQHVEKRRTSVVRIGLSRRQRVKALHPYRRN